MFSLYRSSVCTIGIDINIDTATAIDIVPDSTPAGAFIEGDGNCMGQVQGAPALGVPPHGDVRDLSRGSQQVRRHALGVQVHVGMDMKLEGRGWGGGGGGTVLHTMRACVWFVIVCSHALPHLCFGASYQQHPAGAQAGFIKGHALGR